MVHTVVLTCQFATLTSYPELDPELVQESWHAPLHSRLADWQSCPVCPSRSCSAVSRQSPGVGASEPFVPVLRSKSFPCFYRDPPRRVPGGAWLGMQARLVWKVSTHVVYRRYLSAAVHGTRRSGSYQIGTCLSPSRSSASACPAQPARPHACTPARRQPPGASQHASLLKGGLLGKSHFASRLALPNLACCYTTLLRTISSLPFIHFLLHRVFEQTFRSHLFATRPAAPRPPTLRSRSRSQPHNLFCATAPFPPTEQRRHPCGRRQAAARFSHVSAGQKSLRPSPSPTTTRS